MPQSGLQGAQRPRREATDRAQLGTAPPIFKLELTKIPEQRRGRGVPVQNVPALAGDVGGLWEACDAPAECLDGCN